MLFGVFHGDLHGGNLFVRPDGTVALLDYGITGRLDEPRRLAFLRLLMGGTINDPKLQLAALRDLGALPPDTDLDAVIGDLGLDQPVKDPTPMDPEELVAEIRDLTKALLGYGARLPKVLMLFVKDLLFLDGALATLAPDVDLFQEITDIADLLRHPLRRAHRRARSASTPGSRRWTSTASRPRSGSQTRCRPSPTGTCRQRRETIRRRMEEHQRGRHAERAGGRLGGRLRRRWRRWGPQSH